MRFLQNLITDVEKRIRRGHARLSLNNAQNSVSRHLPIPVFQLGLFMRVLRPAHTGWRPARFTRALPELKKKKIVLFLQNVIAFFVFSDSRCKNACRFVPMFHQSPTRPNFGRSLVKVCPILCRLRTKLCPFFGCSRARLCPITFAPCPFPNLAGALHTDCLIPYVC